MSENTSNNTTGLLLSKEHRLFGMVEYAIFRGEAKAFKCVTEWEYARNLLVETHFDLVMIDESAVVHETFESFSSFVKMLAAENTVVGFFVRTMTPDLELVKKVLNGVVHFVDMTHGKEEFLKTLESLKELAKQAQVDEERKRQTISLDETMGRVERSLPLFSVAEKEEASFSRLLYAVRFRRFYGNLVLRHHTGGEATLRVIQGRFVKPTKEQIDYLLRFFADPRGSYQVKEDPEAKSSLPVDAMEPMDLIWEGALTKAPLSLLEAFLKPYLDKRVMPTNLFRERRVRYSGIAALIQLVEACERYNTLKEAMAHCQNLSAQQVRAAALFALSTDMLVVAEDDNTYRIAQVIYPREVRQQRQKATDRAKQSTKAFRITLSDLQRVQIEDELRARAEKYAKSTPYEILDVWQGCGKKVVNDAFYKAVREHHPDTYGGNVSAETKKLADRVFVAIQKARGELLRRESTQTVPARPGTAPPPSKVVPARTLSSMQSGPNTSEARLTGERPAQVTGNFDAFYDDNSVAQLRAGLMDISSEISDADDSAGLGAEVTDPELRKQRIRALHEKRRRLSSVNNMLGQAPHTPPRPNRLTSQELPALSKLNPNSSAQVVGLTQSPSQAGRINRLERLSNRSVATYTPPPRPTKPEIPVITPEEKAEHLLQEGLKAFERSDWLQAVQCFANAHHYKPDQKRIDTYLWYSRYKLDPTTYSRATIENLKLCTSNDEAAFFAYQFLGNIYNDLEDFKHAILFYTQALSLQNDPELQERVDELNQKVQERSRSGSIFSKFFSKKR